MSNSITNIRNAALNERCVCNCLTVNQITPSRWRFEITQFFNSEKFYLKALAKCVLMLCLVVLIHFLNLNKNNINFLTSIEFFTLFVIYNLKLLTI